MDERHFLFALVQSCLHQLIKSEFDRFINVRLRLRRKDRHGISNGSYPRCFKTRMGRLELNNYRDWFGLFRSEFYIAIREVKMRYCISVTILKGTWGAVPVLKNSMYYLLENFQTFLI